MATVVEFGALSEEKKVVNRKRGENSSNPCFYRSHSHCSNSNSARIWRMAHRIWSQPFMNSVAQDAEQMRGPRSPPDVFLQHLVTSLGLARGMRERKRHRKENIFFTATGGHPSLLATVSIRVCHNNHMSQGGSQSPNLS